MTTATRRMALVLLSAPFLAPCLAQDPVEVKAQKVISQYCTPEPPDYRIPSACAPARFRAYEPNYAVYQWTKDDESAFRLHYSFRYLVFTADCIAPYRVSFGQDEEKRSAAIGKMKRCFEENNKRHEWYLMYTGEFDFYMGSRPSGPVINRISNPGFHFRQYVDAKDFGGMRWWDIGVEHRSDGQTGDPRQEEIVPGGRKRVAQTAYENGDHAYFDSLSRDTNYFTFETNYRLRGDLDFYARVKGAYFGNKTEITWGPLADQDVKMWHYDRFRFIFGYRLSEERPHYRRSEEKRLYIEWTVGDKGLQTDSFNVGLYFPVPIRGLHVPLYARVHRGPLQTLSDYTKEQTSLGIGLLFLE